MQGVSINFFVKIGKKKANELGKVFHYDLYGKRNSKYEFLKSNSLKSVDFAAVNYNNPFYFFVPKNQDGRQDYESGFRVDELFPSNVTGIVTARDSVVIDIDKNTLLKRMEKFTDEYFTDREIRSWLFPNKKDGKYLAGNSRGWKLELARKQIASNEHKLFIKKIDYRPFDIRNIYYSSDMVDWGRENLMRHFLEEPNIGLMICRQTAIDSWEHIGITKYLADDSRVSNRSRERGYILPLYLYPEKSEQSTLEYTASRNPNLNQEIVKQIADKLGLTFTNEKETTENTFAPIDILDYIYAVLHSPTYREKYKEFLKIDFPRVPYPKDQDTFWKLIKLGGEIRQIHLLESATVEQYITQYPISGDNLVSRKMSKNSPGYVPNNKTHGKVYINDEQYFDNVPLVAWEFYIGGYQPAQKWLKDRNGHKLEWEDIAHYQKIIVALSETDRIMKEIDEIKI
jgi:predicted helicase